MDMDESFGAIKCISPKQIRQNAKADEAWIEKPNWQKKKKRGKIYMRKYADGNGQHNMAWYNTKKHTLV
jgi:hypothetical protein